MKHILIFCTLSFLQATDETEKMLLPLTTARRHNIRNRNNNRKASPVPPSVSYTIYTIPNKTPQDTSTKVHQCTCTIS